MSRYGTARGGMQTSSLNNDKYICPICGDRFAVGHPLGGFYAHFTRKSILLCNDQYKRKRIKREVWHCLVEDDKKKWNEVIK
jgi:ribosomal protein L37AE/L43A